MEEVKLIYSVDKLSNLRSIVKQDLRELGIKVPKQKKPKKLNQSRSLSQDSALTPNIFGNYLSLVPSRYIADCGFVPKFLTEAAEIIERHSDVEGIFRKSGSITRQKELKQQIEEGGRLQTENVHDVTGIVKQFFRELPEPLFTSVYHDTFVRCYHLDSARQVEAMLLLCLMLPVEHLSTLRFTMKLLASLATHNAHNKMDVGNLAVILAPNIMHVNSRSQKMNSTEEKLLQIQTSIVGLLIRSAGSIGVVSDSLFQRTALMTECFGTEDELDASDDNTLEDSKENKEVRKKARKRSSSLQGIVSSIGRGLSKLRRSTDGKNMSSAVGMDSQDSEMMPQASQSESLSVSQAPAEMSLPSHHQAMATPIVMRKRRMSGDAVPFSATKRKAILDQLPHKSALGATPFTPASSKKRHHHSMRVMGLDTPAHSLTADQSQLAPEATPRQDNKSIRKKINLFSPASNRKAKRVKSDVVSCSSGLRKSARTKHLLRRLSGGKEKEDGEEEEEEVTIAGVPQSQSAMELSGSEKSTMDLGLTRTVSSPTLHPPSSPPSCRSPEDPNSLNQGFIDPDLTACVDPTVPQAAAPRERERGRTLRRADSFKPGQMPVQQRRSSSTDGPLRRGQPNKLSNGLLEGKTENLKRLRRSFDKSDIGDPIPVVPRLADRTYFVDSAAESACVSSVSASCRSHADRSITAVTSEVKVRASSSSSDGGGGGGVGGAGEQSMMEMENSLLNVVLPPPSGFNDLSMMEMSVHREQEKMEGSDNESDAGFSTISGGTVIHRPPADLHSLQPGMAGSSAIVHYGSSVSVSASRPAPPTLQTSISADSLISTESESSEAGLVPRAGALDRSISMDSGKGSLLDNAESRPSSRASAKPGVMCRDLKGARIQLEGRGSSSAENLPSYFTAVGSVKSVSAEDLKGGKRVEKPAGRSHSMHVGGSCHPPNIIPNLQISADTHRLLTRAGFLESSLPPYIKDAAVPVRSPQNGDSTRQSFRRDQRHTCSFRLEKSATFRKERSSVLYANHPAPVQEEACPDQADMEEEQWTSKDAEHGQEEPMEEDLTHTATHISGHDEEDSSKREEEDDEVWVMREPGSARRDSGGQHTPRSSVHIKRAEVRLQKHESVAQLQEKGPGRVAQTVHQINSSMDQSTDLSHTSLHFHHCTTRTRGLSPVRIPTIFAKSAGKADNSARYQELAQRHHSRAGHQEAGMESADRSRNQSLSEASCHRNQSLSEASSHRNHSLIETSCASARSHVSPKKGSKMGIDLSTSLLDTIEEVMTPRRHKRPAAGHPTDGSRSPLREFTNTTTTVAAVSEASVRLRTTKGLTPHQVLRYGTKGAGTERSPGKPVKRLLSPRSPHSKHSPQKARDSEAQRLESRRFHEHY